MNWNYWLPWRSSSTDKESESERIVIEGEGPERIVVNKSED